MLYTKAREKRRGFSIAECKTALMELISFYRWTIIVLDALDECERETRKTLAVIFSNLVNKGEGTVKLFIASCKGKDIEKYLVLQKVIAISTADNKDYFEKYITLDVIKAGGA